MMSTEGVWMGKMGDKGKGQKQMFSVVCENGNLGLRESLGLFCNGLVVLNFLKLNFYLAKNVLSV